MGRPCGAGPPAAEGPPIRPASLAAACLVVTAAPLVAFALYATPAGQAPAPALVYDLAVLWAVAALGTFLALRRKPPA